jgi:hypothetical protein
MIFILGGFILGASLIKIYFRKYKNQYVLDIDELIKEYEIIDLPLKKIKYPKNINHNNNENNNIDNNENDNINKNENDNNIDNNDVEKEIINDDYIEKYENNFNVPVITIEHLNKIDENIENKIKDLENSLGYSLKTDNLNDIKKEYLPNNNIAPEVRIFHTIMKKGNLYNDEYKRTINDFVVIEFVRLAHELNINLNESINDENFDIMYAKYVEELIRKKLE